MFWKQLSKINPLDEKLLRLSPTDCMTRRHVQNGGILCVGASGSGKTSGPLRAVGKALVNLPNSGGLILGSKCEDLAMWQEWFSDARRPEDLLVFGPRAEGNLKFNFIDAEMRNGGHTRNVVQCIKVLGETARGQGNKEARDPYFEELETRIVFNAVEIVKLATGKVDASDLQRFLSTAPNSVPQIATSEWNEGFCNQCLRTAYLKQKTEVEQHDYELAEQFWLAEFPAMADKTRSSAMAGVFSTMHLFCTGIVRQLVSGATTVSPDVMGQGKWVYVDTPPCDYGAIGQFLCCGWKFLTQRWVLGRKNSNNLVAIIADEAQQFINSWDSHYIAQCRSHGGSLIFLTQSLASLYGAVAGPSGKHQVDGLLSNFQHKFITTLADDISADWCCKLVGRRKEAFFGGSMAPTKDIYDELFGGGQFTASYSEHYENILQNTVFLSGLRCGGKVNNYLVDCIVLRNGEPFSNGENYLFTTFSQR